MNRTTLAITSIAALLVGLDATVVATALTAVRADLGGGAEGLEWTVNAYTLTFAVFMLSAAALGDRFGRRRVFAAGLTVFALASAACGLAPGLPALIAARAVQGVGAAAVMPLALALLGASVAPERRARALGAFTAVVGVSVPVGPLLGGLFVDTVSWRLVFLINVPVIAVLVPLLLRRVPETRGAAARLDVPGLLLAGAAAFGLVFGLTYANWPALIAGGLLVVAFVAIERRASVPMLPMRLFASRAFTAGNAAILLLWASAFGAVYYMAQFLQVGLGSRPLVAGLQLVPWGAMTVVVPRIVGALIPRVGERWFVAGGMALHGAAILWIAAIASPGLPYWQLVAPLVLSGTGVAAAIPATQSAVLGAVAMPDMGKASGVYSTLRQLGGAVGVAAMVAVFGIAGALDGPGVFTDGFTVAMAVSGALAGVGAVVGMGLRRRTRVPLLA